MDIKGTYRYLFMIRGIEVLIIKREAKRNALISCLMPSGMDLNADKIQNSVAGDKMTEIMAEVADLDAEIRDLLIKKAVWIRRISDAIEHLEDDSEQIVLMEYDLNHRDMVTLAKKINYSLRSAYRIKQNAIKDLLWYLTEQEEKIKLAQMAVKNVIL